MKYTILTLALFCASMLTRAQMAEVSQTVKQFIEAGDDRNVQALEALLHDEYRVVMNRLFGLKEVMVMDKATYVGKIESGEFGGDERVSTIEAVQLNGEHATVRVKTSGKELTMRSDLVLVRNAAGSWQVVTDVPTILP